MFGHYQVEKCMQLVYASLNEIAVNINEKEDEVERLLQRNMSAWRPFMATQCLHGRDI